MSGKSIFRGFLWTYGAQIGSSLIQLAYAATTSRLIHSEGFGVFAIALSTSSLISLIVNGGISQTALRSEKLDSDTTKILQTYALVSGTFGALFLILTAKLWGSVWGTPQLTDALLILSAGVFIGPFAVLASGVSRRNGLFRLIGIATLLANISGMAVGLICLSFWHSSLCLLISPLFSQGVLTIVLISRNRVQLFGFKSLRGLSDFTRYNISVILTKIASYVVLTLPLLIISRFFNLKIIGFMNRADVFTTLPLAQIQVALVQAISPEFRHDRNSPSRANTIWTDILVLFSWLVFPITLLLATIGYFVTPAVLGPGWSEAAYFSIPLALIGGLQILVSVLNSAIETVGSFRVVWLALLAALIGNGFGALFALMYRDFFWLPVGMVISVLLQHLAQIVASASRGFLQLKALFRGYFMSLIFSLMLCSPLVLTLYCWQHNAFSIGFMSLTLLITIFNLFWMVRNAKSLVVVNLLKKYRIISK